MIWTYANPGDIITAVKVKDIQNLPVSFCVCFSLPLSLSLSLVVRTLNMRFVRKAIVLKIIFNGDNFLKSLY